MKIYIFCIFYMFFKWILEPLRGSFFIMDFTTPLKNDAGSAANWNGQIAICPFRVPHPGRYRHGSQTSDDGTELISGVGDRGWTSASRI